MTKGEKAALDLAGLHLQILVAERLRIRRELLDAIGAKRNEWSLAKPLGAEITKSEREIGADAAFQAVLNALDRIIPEEG